MLKRAIILSGVISLSLSLALGGGNTKKVIAIPVVPDESGPVVESKPYRPLPPDVPLQPTLVGTYTGLQGFLDYQINGGAAQHIRVNPANGHLHVVCMATSDSPAVSGDPSRRTLYAYSTDGGTSWNNFNNLTVPDRRSGFGTLDLGTGQFAGAAIIANHSIITGSNNQGTVFVDFPEGSGAFAEISPPTPFGSDEPIWPFIASASDGSVVMKASRQTAGTNHYARTADFVSWSPYATFPGTNSAGGRYPTHANGTGRVGILLQAVTFGTFFLESTNNGVTWPSSAIEIHPDSLITSNDTLQAWVGADFIYDGNTPLFVVDELTLAVSVPGDGAQIGFYSTATGWKNIATKANTPNVPLQANRTQSNHSAICSPAIGMSGSTLVVLYVAMQRETSAVGFNYCDVFAIKSTNSGSSWSTPYNVTQTPNLDERYPAISPWNETGIANITWQEDTQPGSAWFPSVPDNAPLTRARQKFLKLNLALLTGIGEGSHEVAAGFRLAQNYPNPFNPATKIDYSVAKAGLVTIKVYDILGKEVATLLNEELQPGSYQVAFSAQGGSAPGGDGRSLASGLYMYKMTAPGFTQTKKMMLVK
jgi:hypothetical protein